MVKQGTTSKERRTTHDGTSTSRPRPSVHFLKNVLVPGTGSLDDRSRDDSGVTGVNAIHRA